MSAELQGVRVLAKLVAGLPVDDSELDDLAEPWRGLARAVLADTVAPSRRQALDAAIARHPDRASVRRAILTRHPAVHRAVPDPVLVHLTDVAARPVRWLWPGRVPLGKLTILDGDPGLGKSVLSLDLAARVTAHRPMPDGTLADLAGSRGVVLLSAEDALEDTIQPRLVAAGADLAGVVALTSVAAGSVPGRPRGPAADSRTVRLPTLADLHAIRQAVAAVGAALVVVDPIMAYLPRGVDASMDAAIRAVLARLAALAEAEGIAVLVVRHLNKSRGRNPLYRGGGSIGIIGAARSGLLVAPDPDDEAGDRRVLAGTKANLVASAPSLAYRLIAGDNGAPRVSWEGPTAHTAAVLLDRPTDPGGHARGPVAEARDVLRQILADGPKPATAVQAEARAAGVNDRTLRRAREALGILPRKSSYLGAWVWQLPPEAPSPAPTQPRAWPDADRRGRQAPNPSVL